MNSPDFRFYNIKYTNLTLYNPLNLVEKKPIMYDLSFSSRLVVFTYDGYVIVHNLISSLLLLSDRQAFFR